MGPPSTRSGQRAGPAAFLAAVLLAHAATAASAAAERRSEFDLLAYRVFAYSSAALAAPDRRTELDALVDRVVAYVEQFHQEMEGAVLEESYVQALRKRCCSE